MSRSVAREGQEDISEPLRAGIAKTTGRGGSSRKSRDNAPSSEQPTQEEAAADELVFCFTRAQGTDLDPIKSMLEDALEQINFLVREISLSAVLWRELRKETGDERDYDSVRVSDRERSAMIDADQFRAHS